MFPLQQVASVATENNRMSVTKSLSFQRMLGMSLNAGDVVKCDINILVLNSRILWVKKTHLGYKSISETPDGWDHCPTLRRQRVGFEKLGSHSPPPVFQRMLTLAMSVQSGQDLLNTGELASRATLSRGGLNPSLAESVEVCTEAVGALLP